MRIAQAQYVYACIRGMTDEEKKKMYMYLRTGVRRQTCMWIHNLLVRYKM